MDAEGQGDAGDTPPVAAAPEKRMEILVRKTGLPQPIAARVLGSVGRAESARAPDVRHAALLPQERTQPSQRSHCRLTAFFFFHFFFSFSFISLSLLCHRSKLDWIECNCN